MTRQNIELVVMLIIIVGFPLGIFICWDISTYHIDFSSLQSLGDVHWSSKTITFNDNGCPANIQEIIERNYKDIVKQTNISLNISKTNKEFSDIKFVCYNNENTESIKTDGTYTLGLTTNLYNPDGTLTSQTIVELWKNPSVQTIEHEEIHSLGINHHSADPCSIMYSKEHTCWNNYIDNETKTELKEMYP